MNGGRVVTDRDLYEKLDDQAVREPERFRRPSISRNTACRSATSSTTASTKLQKALAEGKSDPAFERHSLGRLFLEEGLRAANLDPNGEEGRTARQQLDRLLGAFESVEGKPPTMADIRGLVDDVVGGMLPRGKPIPILSRSRAAIQSKRTAIRKSRNRKSQPRHPGGSRRQRNRIRTVLSFKPRWRRRPRARTGKRS